MAKQNRTTLKGYFETGDIPNQNQYADLIDSNLNLSETTDQTTAGGLNITGNVTSSGNISASGGGFFGGDIQLDNNQALIGKKLNNVTMNLAKVNSSGLIFLGDSLTNTTYVEGEDIIIGKSSATSLTTVLNDFKVNGNITASGNVSSSGIVIGNIGTFGTLTNVNTTHVTASGNISASGNIISSQITSSGGILNKGNLFQEKSIALNQNKPLQAKSGSSYADLIKLDSNGTTLVGNSSISNVANETEFFTFKGFKFKVNPSYAFDPVGYESGGSEIVRISGGKDEPTGLYIHGVISASRTITGNNLKLDGSQVDFTNLPTSDPNVAGRLYNDGGSLKISAG